LESHEKDFDEFDDFEEEDNIEKEREEEIYDNNYNDNEI
jgi:hypothetical protein